MVWLLEIWMVMEILMRLYPMTPPTRYGSMTVLPTLLAQARLWAHMTADGQAWGTWTATAISMPFVSIGASTWSG